MHTYAKPGSMTPGLEGSVLFVRLTDPGGVVVLDAEFEWPEASRSVPAGTYDASAYFRVCGGNCGNLDPGEMTICTSDDITLAAGDTLLVDLYARNWNLRGTPCQMSVEG